MAVVDIAIVGGGPAGTAAALALRQQGLAVVVIESSRYETWRIGETVPPKIRPVLQQLGLWQEFLEGEHEPSYAIASAWGSPHLYYQDFIFNPYGCGWHLDRRRFDQMLATAAERVGATVYTPARVTSIQRCGSRWHLKVAHEEGQALSLWAEFLLDATGRRSVIGRRLGRRRLAYDRLMGLMGFLSPATVDKVEDILLVETVEEGWWYSAPLPDGRLLVACMTDSDLIPWNRQDNLRLWMNQLNNTVHTRERVQSYQMTSEVVIRSASTTRLDQPTASGFFALGDAAMTFDPLSAQGVYKAILSGIRAAEVIGTQHARKDVLDECRAALDQEFEDYINFLRAYYRQEVRWPTSLFWQRRQLSP